MRLEGRRALITGGGSGLGRAMAVAFAREGARVAVTDVREDTAKETIGLLDGEGHLALGGDVTDSAKVAEIVGEVAGGFGGIDVLVNNAGVDRAPGDGSKELFETGQQLVHMTDEGFTRLMDVNVNGVFYFTRDVAKVMQGEKAGDRTRSIVNMSSIAGISNQGGPHYAASKAAVLGLTRACARELARFGIRVNAICPGAIDTPMTRQLPEPVLEGLKRATPIGRLGQAEDIASSAVFLAGEESSFITGQWLSPNGGLIMA